MAIYIYKDFFCPLLLHIGTLNYYLAFASTNYALKLKLRAQILLYAP